MKWEKPTAELKQGNKAIKISKENEKEIITFSCDPPCQ